MAYESAQKVTRATLMVKRVSDRAAKWAPHVAKGDMPELKLQDPLNTAMHSANLIGRACIQGVQHYPKRLLKLNAVDS